ncbi:MAG: phosphoadenylyl-sulfate reductase [Acidobacteriota bacterium]
MDMGTIPTEATATDLERLPARDLLAWALDRFGSRFAISTSFQREGLAIVDMALRLNPATRIFTLDTGRLPQETYQVMEAIRSKYGARIELVYPATDELEAMTSQFGPDLFRESVAHRKLCCQIRKVRPLERKMAEFDAFAVGLRREQSSERAGTPKAVQSGGKWKLAPIADWTSSQVEEYLTNHDVPRHPLESRGYPSIGCAPCTRAIAPGESERAGRWWWESEAGKECGLHVTPEGQMKRELDVLLEEVLTPHRSR